MLIQETSSVRGNYFQKLIFHSAVFWCWSWEFFQFGLLPSQSLQLLYFQGLSRCSYKIHKDKHKGHKCSSLCSSKIYSWFVFFEKIMLKKCASVCCSAWCRSSGDWTMSALHVNRAADLYLCRTGCLSLLACFLNLSASHSLIYTHSHLGADHCEHQFSTVSW